MTIRVAHIYAASAKSNSGDYMIGVAYKAYFKECILQKTDVMFVDFDCRVAALFDSSLAINKLNQFDYLLVGGGGLVLPDTNPNSISCWQWVISTSNLEKLTSPIYVLGLGYNTFFGQTMLMPNHTTNHIDPKRESILRTNLSTLIRKADRFTMRHKADVSSMTQLVGMDLSERISYEMCATHWYATTHWHPNTKPRPDLFAIEIKDDRQWRRYHKIGQSKAYAGFLIAIKQLLAQGKRVCYLSHDGSRNFHDYAIRNGVRLPYLDNATGKEEAIRHNYEQIGTLLCMAGHSQIIGHAMGCHTLALVTHPKTKNFCDDIGSTDYVMVNDYNNPMQLAKAIADKM